MGTVNSQLMVCARQAKKPPSRQHSQCSWSGLADEEDSVKVWQKIGWNGSTSAGSNANMPSDDEFKQHFEALLNPPDAEVAHPEDYSDGPYVPLMDDPFRPEEVDAVIRKMKSNHSGVPSGVAPGLLKCLNNKLDNISDIVL